MGIGRRIFDQHGHGYPLQKVGVAFTVCLRRRQLDIETRALFAPHQSLLHTWRPLPAAKLQRGGMACERIDKHGARTGSGGKLNTIVQG